MSNAIISSLKIDRYYNTYIIGTLLCFCILFLGANELIGGTIYYVAADGNNNNSGTSAGSPWATLQKAADNVAAGDTVYIKAGIYGVENVIFPTSGTQNSPITFEGYKNIPGDNPSVNYTCGDTLNANEMPLLDGGNRATAGTAITLHKRSYIAVKNIQIQHYNIGIYGYRSENCIIENALAINLGDPCATYDGKGIAFGTYANNNILKNCIVANASAEGINVSGNMNLIEGCQVYCDDPASIEASMDYYIIVGGNYNTIIGCYVERIGELPHGGHGIQLKYNAEYNLIKDCISVNQGGFGVRHRGVKYNIFENCIALGGNGENARSRGLIVRDGASYNTFKNCRTQGVQYATIFFDTKEDEMAQSAGSYNKFENCIFENTVSSCIYFSYYDLESPAFNNDFINCTFSGGENLFYSQRTNYGNKMFNCIVTNISNMVKTGSPYSVDFEYTYSNFWNNGFSTPVGAGNFSGDPLFVDPNAGDFRLRVGSACIDAGTTVSIADDYDFSNRPYGWGYDVGAHEYVDKKPLVQFKLNEDIGITTKDEMTNIPNGTINGAIWVEGLSGSALSFNGTDGTVTFGNHAQLNMTGSRSISAWIKPTQNGTYNTIVAKYFWGWSLSTRNGKLYAYVQGSTTSASSTSSTYTTVGEWQHVAMTFDINGDKKIHLYINGEEATYSSQVAMVGTPLTTTHKFSIGSDFGSRYWFNGVIDEVKVYIRALSQQEVFDEFTTIFSANLDEGVGDNVNDYSINGINGTINGALWVEGISGSALNFNGVDNSVNFGNPTELNIEGSRSISAWIKPTQTGTYNTIVAKYFWGWSLSIRNGKLYAYVRGSTVSAYSYSSKYITMGEWQHVAMTFDVAGDKKIHLYINGEEVTSSSHVTMAGSPVTTVHNFSIGSDYGYRYWFDGVIDEVKVFHKALSPNEVANIYQTY